MSCSCQQQKFEQFESTGTDFDRYQFPTTIGQDENGNAECIECYMKRAGDPKYTSQGESTKFNPNKVYANPLYLATDDSAQNKVTLVQTVYDEVGSSTIDKASSIIIEDDNTLNAEFILNEPTKSIGLWGYKWVSCSTDKKPTISAVAKNNNYSLFLKGVLPRGAYMLQIMAYEGQYAGDDYNINEDDNTQLPLIDKQTFSINANSASKEKPLIINMPVLGKPKILARYGISYGVKTEDGSDTYDRTHTGVDFGINSSVVAASDGIVVDTGTNDYYGKYILMRNNGLDKSEKVYTYTLYATLGSITAKKSNKIISTGTIIGTTGISGLSDTNQNEPQMHFEVIRSSQMVSNLGDLEDFEWIDPLSVINGKFEVEGGKTIVVDNSKKSKSMASSDSDSLSSNNCNAGKVQYDPANIKPINVDPSATKAGSFMEAAFKVCMESEISPGYSAKYHNSQPTIQGCPGSSPVNTPTKKGRSMTSGGVPCGWHITYVPLDRGGETKYGVAKNSNPTVDYSKLNRDQAMTLFVNKYVKAFKCDQITNKMFACCFSSQVYQGPALANKSARFIISQGGYRINTLSSKILTPEEIDLLNKSIDKLGYDNACQMFLNRFGQIWSRPQGYENRKKSVYSWCKASFG